MLIYLRLLLTATFWGGTFIAGRVIANDIGPFSAAFSRFAIASLLLLGLTWQAEGHLPPIKRRHVIPILLLGLTGIFAYNLFFFKGLQLIRAGRASVIVASNPIFIILLSALFLKEKINLFKALGIILSVTGAVIVISKGNPVEILTGSLGRGELYIFGCALSWVVYSLVGKAVMAELSPLTAVAYSSMAGAILLLLPAYFEGLPQYLVQYSTLDWLALLYLALLGTVLGFRWYYEGIKRIGPTKTSTFINFVPISGVLLGFFILKEPITLSLLTGTILVSSGVYLTNTATLSESSRKWGQRTKLLTRRITRGHS
jgi:drug/metabolite transporter (DMT)-like permease